MSSPNIDNIAVVSNQKEVGNHFYTDLADLYKTPLYVYDGDQIQRNFKAFQKAVSRLNSRVYFAVKANSSIAILSLLKRVGAGADVVSGGEL